MFSEIYESGFDSHLIAPEASLLHMLWQMARGARDIPDEDDIPHHRLEYLRKDLMILRAEGERDWRYVHYGSNIAAQAGFDMTGKCVSDFKGVTRDFYLDVYARVRRERRALATAHRLGQFGERPLWERLILPLGTPEMVTTMLVLNKVREIEKDISHHFVRARGRGMFILQFRRDSRNEIIDAEIIGANARALALTNRRFDQVVGHSALTVFPGLLPAGVWERYIAVAITRLAEELRVGYHADGIDGTFLVHISPYLDGITVDFEQAGAAPVTSSQVSAA